jgi:hypothetical protein
MPTYYTNEDIIHMFVNSIEVINSYDIKLGHIKQKLNTISIYVNAQKLKDNKYKYFDYQLIILRFTELIGYIIYPESQLTIKSIISNNIVTIAEEKSLILSKLNDLKLELKSKQFQKATKKIINKLNLAQMNKLLPIDIIENVAQHLVNKRPSKKKSRTNWQNFCKHRKLAGLNYKKNSSVWNSLSFDIKCKYKNQYYTHF